MNTPVKITFVFVIMTAAAPSPTPTTTTTAAGQIVRCFTDIFEQKYLPCRVLGESLGGC
jgi:hypothetical protein